MLETTEMGKTPSDGGRNEVRVFENARFGQVRTAQGASGEPLFCLADVCKVLGLQTNKVKQRINSRGWNTIPTPTYNLHGALVMQEMNFIDEPNLYRCIFQSRKEEAELFQDWVCEEVLPAIRQTGGYLAHHSEDTPELIMARALQKYSTQILVVSKLCCTFVAVTDGSCTYFAEQAVKLLTSKVGFFIAHMKDIGGCLLRKIIKALGVEMPSVTSAKWQPLFPMPTNV